jgi:hypothetical protein
VQGRNQILPGDNVRPVPGLDPKKCAVRTVPPLYDRLGQCRTCGFLRSDNDHCHLLETCNRCHSENDPCGTAATLTYYRYRF